MSIWADSVRTSRVSSPRCLGPWDLALGHVSPAWLAEPSDEPASRLLGLIRSTSSGGGLGPGRANWLLAWPAAVNFWECLAAAQEVSLQE